MALRVVVSSFRYLLSNTPRYNSFSTSNSIGSLPKLTSKVNTLALKNAYSSEKKGLYAQMTEEQMKRYNEGFEISWRYS